MSASYPRTLERLARLARFGMRPGTGPIRKALAAHGDPHLAIPALHIAGTNGKGSTAAFAEAMLGAAGLRVGLYTSPHLVRFTERVRVGGREIDGERMAAALDAVLDGPGGAELTFFEAATAAAFVVFADARLDLLVLECGLGGRYDATSVCAPAVTVITSIALDHTEVLGDSVEKIAFEKAGIARAGVPLVVGRAFAAETDGALAVIARHAAEVGAPLLRLGQDFTAHLGPKSHLDYAGPGGALADAALGLDGAHQATNAALALAATALLPARFRPDERARRRGLAEVRWPGRLERLAPDLLVDGAHNEDGAAALAAALGAELRASAARPTLIIGMLADKDVDAVLRQLVPIAGRVVCTRPASPRALPAADLAAHVRRLVAAGGSAIDVLAVEDIAEALERARGAPRVVCGSLYLAGAVRALVLGEAADQVVVSDPVKLETSTERG